MRNPLRLHAAKKEIYTLLHKAGWTLPDNTRIVIGKAYGQDVPCIWIPFDKGEVALRRQFHTEGKSFIVISYESYTIRQVVDLEPMRLIGVSPKQVAELIAKHQFDTQLTPENKLLKVLAAAGWDLEDKHPLHTVENGVTYIVMSFGKSVVTFRAQGNSFIACSYRSPTGKKHTLTQIPQGISPKAFAALVAKYKLDE